ncbi:transmembrane protein 244 isoform X2 [Cebus imitator]|uniref:transmembrane protein 244 isoform X2 n=1 Tax=Cebus imitator TaxID=2715852 RepID=UPI00080A2763|nr:transmembrane protein 244 isoform X2 [Cebus imitator]
MALQVRLAPSKVVLQKLLLCVILFYTVYYVSLSVGCVMFQVHELDFLAPFDFKTNPSWRNIYYKVLLVSTEVTYFVCGLLFVPVVEEWVWDYAISVTILHVAITSTVMLEFPLTSHWWAALGSGLISMICGGQILAYCLFKDNFIYPGLDNF